MALEYHTTWDSKYFYKGFLMKKMVYFICSLFLFSNIGVYAQSVDLNTGIRNGATYFEQNLERGFIIAVLSIRSDYPSLSEYVIDELSSHLVNGRIFTVVDRNYMDEIQHEMNYQLSGDVSDETAQSIGKRIGAQTVITGSVQTFGNNYRLDLRALSVETGVIQGVLRQDIAIDNRIRTLIGVPLVDSTGS
jgi:TolB-like protein